MYSDVFCKVYNEFGWNYYPEIFGEQLLQWLERQNFQPKNSMDLGCGTGLELEAIFEKFPEIHVTGVDLSWTMLM